MRFKNFYNPYKKETIKFIQDKSHTNFMYFGKNTIII